MSFKNQSVFSATYTNTTFTVTEEMGVSSITVNLVSGSATLYGDLQFPGLTNSTVALTSGQPVVLTANKGYTLTGIIVDSTAGGVFQVYTIYQALDGTRPVNTVAPAISGTGVVGQTLTTTDGTWTGDPIPTYTYQWQRNGSPISGATSSTYVLVSADAGTNVRCVVTATNAIGAASANSNAIAVISFEQSLINAFKTRVQNDGGTYEAESCQLAQLTALNAIA